MEQVFTNGQTCKAKIIELIGSASKEIKIAMAFFTDRDIASALLSSKTNKNTKISIILSDDLNNETIKSILQTSCDVYIFKVGGRGIMHHKFCIIDSSTLIHGSFNYTYNAVNNNEESLNVTDSYNMVSEYSNIFETLLSGLQKENGKAIEHILPAYKTQDDSNYLDKFTDQLKNIISQIFDTFNHEEISNKGKALARESDGAEAIFLAYLDSTLEDVNKSINQDEHTKVLVKTRMAASLDNAVETNIKDLESDTKMLNNHSNNIRATLQSQIEIQKERKKNKQDEFNVENSKLTKTKSNISELNDEIDGLDRQIVVHKFWTFPTFLKLALTTMFLFYLLLFFGSAIWKIFFEETEIIKLLQSGITPDAPPLFDANALYKIYSKKGIFYGIIASIFFVIPVLLASIKLFAPKNKFIEYFIGWIVAIFAIDVVVSLLISQDTFKIKQMVYGSSGIWDFNIAIKSGEFWLIFIFGALPLFITKFLIESIWSAYNNSNPEFVDREKFLLRNSLRRKLSEQNPELEVWKSKLEMLNSDLDELNKAIQTLSDERSNIDVTENNDKFKLQERIEKRNKNLREIYNSFISSVESGNKLFLQNVVNGRVTAFRSGFYLHLTEHYSPRVAAGKIESLEIAHKNWVNKNFA